MLNKIFIILFLLLSFNSNAAKAPLHYNNQASNDSFSSTDQIDLNYETVPDPFETYNRLALDFNFALDTLLVEPVAYIYKSTVPKPFKMCINNFFSNLYVPVTVINNLLQGDAEKALINTSRFSMNLLMGFGGIVDVAGENNISYQEQDFGLTLKKWGFKPGFYFVAPIIGPTSLRDSIGKVVDFRLDYNYKRLNNRQKIMLYYLKTVNARSNKYDFANQLKYDSLDTYSRIRSLYLQSRD